MKQAVGNFNRKSSISGRFNGVLAILYVLSILFTIPGIYFFSEHSTYQESRTELSLLVDLLKAVRKDVAEDIRPGLIEKDFFYLPAMSGLATTARIGKQFAKLNPNYYVKIASDNPINPINAPEPFEQAVLQKYREGNIRENLIETGSIRGKHYLFAIAPTESKPKCLKCHGNPAKAPLEVVSQYGTNSGYNYKLNDVVGINLVGVPIKDINAIVLQRSLIGVGILTLFFTVVFVTFNVLLRKIVIRPIIDLSNKAVAVSQGDIEQPIQQSPRNDEISVLANAFELMRRSVVVMLSDSGKD